MLSVPFGDHRRRASVAQYRRARFGEMALTIIAICGLARNASADMITFTGSISQPQDQTNPATNNPTLNSIQLGDPYSVTIDFLGSIASAGLHPLSLNTMSFNDPSAGASETSFNSASVTVSADGSLFDISILGCLPDGCGDFLSANFSIPMAGLNAHGVPATFIPALVPSMDLLEDGGSTDIQGSVTGYSYTASVVAATPEPSELSLLSAAISALILIQLRRRKRGEQQS